MPTKSAAAPSKKPAAPRAKKPAPERKHGIPRARKTVAEVPHSGAGVTAGMIRTVGRRKTAIARLRFVREGQPGIMVNGVDYKEYFPYALWQEVVAAPLPQVGLAGLVEITIKVSGGGKIAQAEAIRLALSRALILHNPDWRPTLRSLGYLTRDPREKERKKPGLKRARRAPQWRKR